MTSPLVLPHDLDAEAAVLSAVLLAPEAYYEAAPLLVDRDFYSDANRWIWRAIVDLERAGSAYDVVLVAGWLREREKLQVVGGSPYLAQITEATPAIANVREHARIVAGLGYRRRLLDMLKIATATVYAHTGDAWELGQRVEQSVYETAGARVGGEDEDGSLGVVIPAVLDDVLERSKGKREPPGTSTGFPSLDAAINGLKSGKVYVVGGRPGMGKSAFCGQVATHIASLGRLVVEISTEQSRAELAMRKLAQGTGVAYKSLEAGKISGEDWDRIVAETERLRRLPLALEHLNAPTIGQLRSTVRRALAKLRRVFGDLPLGLVVLDQLQHFDGEEQRGEKREGVVARMSREIAWMAQEFGCPVLLAAQLNREPEGRPDKRPVLSDLRESGAVEADAFGVLFPFRPAYYERKDRGAAEDATGYLEDACIIVAKNKNGPAPSVALTYDGPSMAFGEPDPYAGRQTAMGFGA